MTSRELQKKCQTLLLKLNMHEWVGCRPNSKTPKVVVRIKTAKDMVVKDEDKEEILSGSCEWSTEYNTAEINLLKGEDLDYFLKHEVLHLLLEGHTVCEGYDYDPLYERAINRLVEII